MLTIGRTRLPSYETFACQFLLDCGLVFCDFFFILNGRAEGGEQAARKTANKARTLIQSGRFGPQPKQLILSRIHVLQESP